MDEVKAEAEEEKDGSDDDGAANSSLIK